MNNLSNRLHLDIPLSIALLTLVTLGLGILYSASGQDHELIHKQVVRLAIAFGVMLMMSQIHMRHFRFWAPWLAGLGIVLLFAVLLVGDIGKGAQRWLDLGFFRFQPSELLKIILPMTVAWYVSEHPLPLSNKQLGVALLIIIVPVALIIQQPDLGTAILIGSSGIFVILLSGVPPRIIALCIAALSAIAPALWYSMRDYQRERVVTLFDPEKDPLGAGYHIIQSKIAIGSGGLYGKGWFNGTQSQLEFLPERSTDFIFAVLAEEFGLSGILLILGCYLFIIIRGLYIATRAQDTFSRLLAGSLSLTFFIYVFVNIGMVSGILPVVGLPLPLISYGGSSMVTLGASFGILMSIHTHRKLLPT